MAQKKKYEGNTFLGLPINRKKPDATIWDELGFTNARDSFLGFMDALEPGDPFRGRYAPEALDRKEARSRMDWWDEFLQNSALEDARAAQAAGPIPSNFSNPPKFDAPIAAMDALTKMNEYTQSVDDTTEAARQRAMKAAVAMEGMAPDDPRRAKHQETIANFEMVSKMRPDTDRGYVMKTSGPDAGQGIFHQGDQRFDITGGLVTGDPKTRSQTEHNAGPGYYMGNPQAIVPAPKTRPSVSMTDPSPGGFGGSYRKSYDFDNPDLKDRGFSTGYKWAKPASQEQDLQRFKNGTR